MDASHTIPTRSARFAALIAIGRIVPITVAAAPIFSLRKSEWRAHRVGQSDAYPPQRAAERSDGLKVANWHGNCLPLLGKADENTIAKHGSSRQRDIAQIRSATHSQEKSRNEGREMNRTAESPTTRSTPPAGCRQDGFTLIEMMTTVVVLIVLLVIGAVSFNTTFKSNRLYSAQNELATSLALARSEAALRGVPVVLTATASATGNEFGGGWTVYADLNANGAFDAGEPVLRSQDGLPGDIVAKTGAATSVTFGSNGFLVPANAITVSICKSVVTSDVVTEYTVVVQPNGMTDVSTTTCP
jgi:type IV fimbrial biogenesis protein FimT